MKINEYNSMMAYLTRPGKVLGNNINSKKISHTGRPGFAKGTNSDTKVMSNNAKMLQYINDHRIVFDGKEATKAESDAAPKRIDSYKNQMSYQDQYNTYFNKKSPKYYNRKEPTAPVEIDFSLAPMQTAGLWSTVKDSSLYKLLDNPRVLGMELGHEGIIELNNLMQNTGLLKKGGRVK